MLWILPFCLPLMVLARLRICKNVRRIEQQLYRFFWMHLARLLLRYGLVWTDQISIYKPIYWCFGFRLPVGWQSSSCTFFTGWRENVLGSKKLVHQIVGRFRHVYEWVAGTSEPHGIELIDAAVWSDGGLLWWRIELNLRVPRFVKVVKGIPHDWRDPVEELPSKVTSLQGMTTLPGIIFAAKVIHYSCLEEWLW